MRPPLLAVASPPSPPWPRRPSWLRTSRSPSRAATPWCRRRPTCKALPRAKATFTAHGKSITYEGGVLNAALKQAGVVSGDRLMGRYLNQVVIAKGSDGFTATYSLGETDPIYRANPVIVADTQGRPAAGRQGRAVPPGRRRRPAPGRSVRQVVSVEVR